MIFIPNHNSPEVLKPGKKALHFPSAPVRSELPSILGVGFLAPFAVRGNHLNLALIHQALIQVIAVIRLVTDKSIGSISGKAAVNCFFNQFHFMGRSAFNVSGDRKTRSVCDCHDLGAFATLRLADSKTPFFAGAKLPSIKASRMSIWPRSYQIFYQLLCDALENSQFNPTLEPPMAGLVGRIPLGHILPWRSCSQDPQNAIEDCS